MTDIWVEVLRNSVETSGCGEGVSLLGLYLNITKERCDIDAEETEKM